MSSQSDENIASLLLLVGASSLLVCLGYQAFTFAKSGTWPPVSVSDALAWMGSTWAAYPTSWYGIHKVLSYMNAGLFVFIPSTITAFALLVQP